MNLLPCQFKGGDVILNGKKIDMMHEKLSREIQRLESLAKVNATIRPEELSLLNKEQTNLEKSLGQARFRLDSIRLVWKGSMARLKN